jgi:hypothetical protein
VTVKLRLAAGAALVFLGVAGLPAAAPAKPGLGKPSTPPTNAAHRREMAGEIAALALDPKCVMAFDTVMESCDGRDFGSEDDQAGDRHGYASADQGDDDAFDGSADDGPEIV